MALYGVSLLCYGQPDVAGVGADELALSLVGSINRHARGQRPFLFLLCTVIFFTFHSWEGFHPRRRFGTSRGHRCLSASPSPAVPCMLVLP